MRLGVKGLAGSLSAMALIWTCESSDAVPADPIFHSPYLVLNDMTADEGGHPLAIGDVNGDQAPDLVLIGSHSDVQPTVRVYLGDGYGNFLKPVISNPLNGRHPWAAVLADFNLDHKLDLALCARSDTVVYVFPGRGDGTFDPAVATGVGARVNSLSVGDMNPERWERVQELVGGALDLPEDDRTAFVERCCKGDTELKKEVLSLLTVEAVDSPPSRWLTALAAPEEDRFAPGDRVADRYRVERLLGRGGMPRSGGGRRPRPRPGRRRRRPRRRPRNAARRSGA